MKNVQSKILLEELCLPLFHSNSVWIFTDWLAELYHTNISNKKNCGVSGEGGKPEWEPQILLFQTSYIALWH